MKVKTIERINKTAKIMTYAAPFALGANPLGGFWFGFVGGATEVILEDLRQEAKNNIEIFNEKDVEVIDNETGEVLKEAC